MHITVIITHLIYFVGKSRLQVTLHVSYYVTCSYNTQIIVGKYLVNTMQQDNIYCVCISLWNNKICHKRNKSMPL